MSYLAAPRAPGSAFVGFGVVLPVFVVFLELATGLCAGAFFDPLPSFAHVVLVLCVPLINFLMWGAAEDEASAPGESHPSPWLAVAGGAGLAISAAYALLFLPLLPIGVLGLIVLGIGLLPLSPLLALVSCARLLARMSGVWVNAGRLVMGGVGIAAIALVAVDVPASTTSLALGWSRQGGAAEARGVRLMRALGDREMLLRLCYGDNGRATGLVSVMIYAWHHGLLNGAGSSDTAAARELYFRVTGEPFSARPMPSEGRRRPMFAGDADQGGTIVGGRARGLSLTQSRIDGSISAADNVAYVEWTAELANASGEQREARMTIAMPAGAVASRATLWVNGEPREASVAGRGAARAAYQSVVQTRRDPLLVTTDGADRLLVQAFPVQPNATLRLRIGMSAPLAIAPDGARSLALPVIADRNFDIADDLAHDVWVEADDLVVARGADLRRTVLANGATRLQGRIVQAVFARIPPRIGIAPITGPVVRMAALPARTGEPAIGVRQTIAKAPPAPPRALTILLDGSAGNADAGPALARALDAIPAGRSVGLVIAADTPVAIAPTPWTPRHARRIGAALADTAFVGGQDNALALALEIAPEASDLLWVHGAQPVAFTRSQGAIDQFLDRSEAPPRLVRYQSAPGPAFRIEDRTWFDAARVVPATGDVGSDLAGVVADLTSAAPRWTITRSQATVDKNAPGSPHIVRLWGAAEMADAPAKEGPQRNAAIALARRLNIVTPSSGAVVLEKDVEYKANGLEVPEAEDVPTVPEPGTWALIIVLAMLGAWMLIRRGFRLTDLRFGWMQLDPARPALA